MSVEHYMYFQQARSIVLKVCWGGGETFLDQQKKKKYKTKSSKP